MAKRWIVLGFLAISSSLSACSDSSTGKETAASTDSGTDSTYGRVGGATGVRSLVEDFVARVVADPKINGYFLNSAVDAARLTDCLVKQVGSATGGPETYDCRSMKEAHAGLGISQQDFDDLVKHFSDALVAAKVTEKDMGTILGVLGPMSADIVEDTTNDQTIYQRIGRKPAIVTVVEAFHGRVMADARINAFFAAASAERLATCLIRQVCDATGGPCVYGKEVLGAEPGVDKSVCRDMAESHLGLGITKADFDALVEDLVLELDAAGVLAADRDAILGVLGPMCPDIVTGGACG